jgi:phosphocarrier protein
MVERDVVVENTLGIHARPASQIIQKASSFQSDVTLEVGGLSADAKSIMSVMMLAAAHKTRVTIRASGRDEEAAAEAIAQLFIDKFGED